MCHVAHRQSFELNSFISDAAQDNIFVERVPSTNSWDMIRPQNEYKLSGILIRKAWSWDTSFPSSSVSGRRSSPRAMIVWPHINEVMNTTVHILSLMAYEN